MDVPPAPMNGAVAPLCVYLLRNATGRTYIGFTNNPWRRLRQHNGEVKGGARKTRLGRPWEMLFFVHGFSTKTRALQFEWGWQHPTMSRFLKGGGLEGLRVGKKSHAASTLAKVLAPLLVCSEFASELLGVHVLRGHWAPPALTTAGADPRLEVVLASCLERSASRAAGRPSLTHGCPLSSRVLPSRPARRRAGGDVGGVDGATEDAMADDSNGEADDDAWELGLLDGGSSSCGSEDADGLDGSEGSEDSQCSTERAGCVAVGNSSIVDAPALSRAFRCSDESESSEEELCDSLDAALARRRQMAALRPATASHTTTHATASQFTHAAFTHAAVTHAAVTHAAVTHTAVTHTAVTHTAVTHTSVTHAAVTNAAASAAFDVHIDASMEAQPPTSWASLLAAHDPTPHSATVSASPVGVVPSADALGAALTPAEMDVEVSAMEVGAMGHKPWCCAQTEEQHAFPDVVDLTADGHGSEEETPHTYTDRDAGPDEGPVRRLGLSMRTNTVTLESSSDDDAPRLTLAERIAARNTSGLRLS